MNGVISISPTPFSDGLRRLRTVINAQGDTSTVLEKAVHDIQMLQVRLLGASLYVPS